MITIADQLNTTKVLSKYQLEQFIEEGYGLVCQEFLREEVSAAFERLWKEAKIGVGFYSNMVAPTYHFVRSTMLQADVMPLMMYWSRNVGIHSTVWVSSP